MTAHILYGFSEGEWHGRRFRRVLRAKGITMTKDIQRSDYIIAHSAGCYDVPPLKEHQILMLINSTYWPGRSLGSQGLDMNMQLIKAVRPGNKPFYHLWKTAHNIFYLLRYPRVNVAIVRRAKNFDFEQEVRHTNTIVVRNDYDPWLTPDLDQLSNLNPHIEIARLKGEHDDCWQYPEPYIELLESYGQKLLA